MAVVTQKKVVVKKAGAVKPEDKGRPEYKGRPEFAKPDAKNILGMADRVSVGFGQKIQIAQYEPVDVNVFYSSDVFPNETVEQAFERVTNVVKKKAKSEIDAIMAVKKKNK